MIVVAGVAVVETEDGVAAVVADGVDAAAEFHVNAETSWTEPGSCGGLQAESGDPVAQ